MNKPASELIALADRISGHLGPFNFITRAERELVVTTLRTAANQSGSERAGVDALREALTNARRKLQLYRAEHCGIYIGGVEYTQLIKQIDAALATPPAQPAPAATHGKPDGAVREALQKAIGEKLHEVEKHGWQPGETAWHRAFGYIAGMHRACDLIAALSPKIAAAEISPGDVLAMKEACKRIATHLATRCANDLVTPPNIRGLGPDNYSLSYGNHVALEIAAAIDRLDVKAEAKSQEPDAVAINGRPYGTDVIDRLSERKLNCRQLSRYIWDRAHNEPDCFEQDIARLIQNERREAVKRATTHPTTKPEAPAVSVDAIRAALRPFIGHDTLGVKVQGAARVVAALIAEGR